VNFAAIALCITSQRVFVVVSVYFVIDSVRQLLDTSSYALFFYVVVPCVGIGLAIGRSTVQGVPPKCLTGFQRV
jgi:hypothetical protein